MKKILLIIGLVGLILCQQVLATVVTQRKINRKELETNIRTCKPYSETLQTEYLGMNMLYNIRIDGWVNGKCRLNFSAQTQTTGSSFKDLYGIDPESANIYSFAPKIRCEFSREQLEYVGDSILQEDERNSGAQNNMLKNPNDINFSNLTSSDLKLMDVIFKDNACILENGQDLDSMMQNLLQF